MKETLFVFTDDIFFRNFRYLKEKYCLSRRALGKLLGMSPYWIQMIEDNQWGNTLEVSKLMRISRIFDLDADDLVTKDLSAQP